VPWALQTSTQSPATRVLASARDTMGASAAKSITAKRPRTPARKKDKDSMVKTDGLDQCLWAEPWFI
jgi:hypothetical protein